MRNEGKRSVLGIGINVCDYEGATAAIIDAATDGRPFSVSACAVHGVMEGVLHPEHRYRLNHFDMLTPDGMPVRWALDLLHRTKLRDRVYGPKLTLSVTEAAAAAGLPIYLYGSTAEVVKDMAANLTRDYPGTVIAGAEPSRFKASTPEELDGIAERIRASGAKICFVGLGCPRQEIWAYSISERLNMPTLCVGLAFDLHAGHAKDAPTWAQGAGFQWIWRLAQEPRRLWKRYLLLNPTYLALLAAQRLGLWSPDEVGRPPDPTAPTPS
jgi:exopolysaccharide biosynthesis WecB/TagA/CpsF family protein